MTPAARISGAIEVLGDIETRRRPVVEALKDWGLSNRFAGSGDRAAIAGLVHDTLRRRRSARWMMEAETARATLLGMLKVQRGLGEDSIASLFSGERFAPEPISHAERAALTHRRLEEAPEDVRADVPEWLWPEFRDSFADQAVVEGWALSERAPLDLRANALKGGREAVLAELGGVAAHPTPIAPLGVRVPLTPDGRPVSVQSDPLFLKGGFEIQDEGSQIASLLAGAQPGEQVLDLCAGGGGKTLAMAAQMGNRGQIFATDSDRRRLAPIHERLQRAGVRNAQVRTPALGGPRGSLPVEDLAGHMDLVLVDAPCTGSGTWRRNPDAKWRLRPNSRADRLADQVRVLDLAAAAVKPGGRLAYITCSVLVAEDDEQVEGFLNRQAGFERVAPEAMAESAGLADLSRHRSPRGYGLLLSPHRTGTDGFFIATLRRTA